MVGYVRAEKYSAAVHWPQPREELIWNQERWNLRIREAARDGLFDLAHAQGLGVTPYAVEAYHYWKRAAFLQHCNFDKPPLKISTRQMQLRQCGDPLQDAIPIYDTVNRRYAGFSNVLEQLWYGTQAPKHGSNVAHGHPVVKFHGSEEEWLYVCLVHRMTGSGASFEHDHGWRNSVVPHMPFGSGLKHLVEFVRTHPGPSGTSIGNQFPAVHKHKPLDGARNQLQRYLADEGVELVARVLAYLELTRATHKKEGLSPPGIKAVVDTALGLNHQLGHKRFVFQLTAWVMDIAEYLPQYVDPTSDCYHGKNAQEALNICFVPLNGPRNQAFFDAGTRAFCNLTKTNPMDVEDAAPGCDLVRWLENYVPRRGFEHVKMAGIYNSSSLRYFKGRQPTR